MITRESAKRSDPRSRPAPKRKPARRRGRRKIKSLAEAEEHKEDPLNPGIPDEEKKLKREKLVQRLRRKYKGRSPKDFSSWYDQERCFWYIHNVAYPEDKPLRTRLMKAVADTANTFIRIQKALGLGEYDFTDNGPLFLDMSLSKALFRKAVKRLVRTRLKDFPSVTRPIRPAGRVVTLPSAAH